MEMSVLGERFEDGAWRSWEHVCDDDDLDAVIDSAKAKAADRFQSQPSHIDFMRGAAYIFDVAYGPRENPRDGDTCVYGTILDGVLIGISEKIKRHWMRPSIA